MTTDPLLTATHLGALSLKHRIVMAPLTRLRSRQPGDVPNALNAEYYGQRARKKRIAQIWRCFRGFLMPTFRPAFQAGRPNAAGSYCAIPI